MRTGRWGRGAATPALLDDLDKELNTYAMRVKEWYGWHFPELSKVIVDKIAFAKTVKVFGTVTIPAPAPVPPPPPFSPRGVVPGNADALHAMLAFTATVCTARPGMRSNAAASDLSDVLPEELETEVKELAEISMGTEISEDDLENITYLCDQVISISEYRAQLYDYLKNRMSAIAPNLTTMVGELVGARLIAHAGARRLVEWLAAAGQRGARGQSRVLTGDGAWAPARRFDGAARQAR